MNTDESLLPSWRNPGAILDFVKKLDATPQPVEPDERIAVFDSDGTLCAEKPMYFQLSFAIDLLKKYHPHWVKDPFQAILSGAAAEFDETQFEGVFRTLTGSFTVGITIDEYKDEVTSWLRDARHTRFERPYTGLIYRPMRELIDYLVKQKQFTIYIVSGSGIEFLRVFWGSVNQFAPQKIVGSTLLTEYSLRAGKPALTLVPWPVLIDSGKAKVLSINEFIGRRPLLAFGNSDGDIEMLQWTCSGDGPRLAGLIHHTDDGREYAYEHKARQALAEARANNWLIVDMKKDWKGDTVFI